jgi:hypothetical protein
LDQLAGRVVEFRLPEGEPFLELRTYPPKLDLPVLRTVTRYGDLSGRMLDDSTFRYYFQRIVCNAGYRGELTNHAFRRAVANVTDSKILFSFFLDLHFLSSFLYLPFGFGWLWLPLFPPEQRKQRIESETRFLGGPHPMWEEVRHTFQDPARFQLVTV